MPYTFSVYKVICELGWRNPCVIRGTPYARFARRKITQEGDMQQDMTDMNAAQYTTNPPQGLSSLPDTGNEANQSSRQQESAKSQHVLIKMYRADDRLMIAAPMPGMEANDITVEVTADNQLRLFGDNRAALKGIKDLLVDEWSVGEYTRVIALPNPVNAQMANVTLGNGVLVVNLPLSDQTTPARLTLNQVGAARAERIGNTGHPVQSSSTNQHVSEMRARQRDAGQNAASDDLLQA
jgi:HSP20 family protein